MKTLTIRCLAAAFIFAIPICLKGQPKKEKAASVVQTISSDEIERLPLFRRGTSIVNLLPNVQFSNMNNGEDPKQVTNNWNMNLRGNYYIIDNVAVVVGIHSNSQNIKKEGVDDQKTSTFVFEVGGQYGTYFGDFPVRAEATVGFGNYNVFSNSASTFAYNVNVATFIELGNSGAYLQPFIGYAGYSNNFKESDLKNKTSGLVLGATVSKPLGCEDYICGFSDEAYAFNPYAKGNNRLQFLQEGGLAFGSNKRESGMGSFNTHDGLFGYSLRVTDYYYAADNLAVGLGAQVDGLNTSDKDSEYMQKQFDFYLSPRVRYHAPVPGAINGLFAEAGFLYGMNNTKTRFSANNETEVKSNVTGWTAGIGYDLMISRNFSVTGMVDYANKTTKVKDTDTSTKSKGMNYLLGMTYTFGR